MKKPAKPVTTALERLKRDAPDGPPFIGLLLDEQTVRRLAAGAVNSRAEVAARRALESFDVKEKRA
jgi:hypothetical protein